MSNIGGCTDCPTGQYQAENNVPGTSCQKCASGKSSAAGSASCGLTTIKLPNGNGKEAPAERVGDTLERIVDDKEVLNQRTAINLINTLHLDVQKEDFIVLGEKLNISEEKAASIKSISATQIFRKDQDGKDFNTPKFEILLSVKDNEIIKNVEDGLLHYFKTNQYINSYYDYFKLTNENEIIAIESEIESLQKFRLEKGSNIDMSSFNVYSKNGLTEVQNQIIELNQLKSISSTNQMLLKPLSFVKGFTISQTPEGVVLILGSLAFFISFKA